MEWGKFILKYIYQKKRNVLVYHSFFREIFYLKLLHDQFFDVESSVGVVGLGLGLGFGTAEVKVRKFLLWLLFLLIDTD